MNVLTKRKITYTYFFFAVGSGLRQRMASSSKRLGIHGRRYARFDDFRSVERQVRTTTDILPLASHTAGRWYHCRVDPGVYILRHLQGHRGLDYERCLPRRLCHW